MKARLIKLHETLFAEMAKTLTPEEIGRLGEEDARGLVARVYSELELRVGKRLCAALSDAEIEEFGDIIDDPESGEIASAVWLEAHCPNYREVVDNTMVEVIEETVEVIAALLRVGVTAAGAPEAVSES